MSVNPNAKCGVVTSPLHQSQRVALVGDAAGYLDALTGEGLCLGLRQAELLANLVMKKKVVGYHSAYRILKRRHVCVVSGLLWLLEQPKLRGRVFEALAGSPRTFQSVINFAVEEAPVGIFANREFPRFLFHLLCGR